MRAALRLLLVRAAILFLGAWSPAYWQGWTFLAVISGGELATVVWLDRNDPILLQRRQMGRNDEQRATQRRVQGLMPYLYLAVMVMSVVDHRNGWSRLPARVTLLGDACVAFGLLVVFLALRANSFAGVAVTVEADQQVVSSGPYAWVRHPLYSGLLLSLAGVPFALDSVYGLIPVAVVVSVVVARLLDEEQFLAGDLRGYRNYMVRVRHRLVPLIW